jgi:hypothetical protein
MTFSSSIVNALRETIKKMWKENFGRDSEKKKDKENLGK